MSSALQHELHQTRPFESPAHEATVALMRTTDVLKRALAAEIEPHGITTQQFNVLRILRGAGANGLPTLEVADRMLEQTPGVTRLLDRLEAKGLVRRQRCQVDRRQHLCWLTDDGRALLARLDEVVRIATQALLGHLDTDTLTTLIRVLADVRRHAAP